MKNRREDKEQWNSSLALETCEEVSQFQRCWKSLPSHEKPEWNVKAMEFLMIVCQANLATERVATALCEVAVVSQTCVDLDVESVQNPTSLLDLNLQKVHWLFF